MPRRDLGLYLEFQGLDSQLAAWRGSAAYKILNETKLGMLLEDLAGQGIELAQQSVPREKQRQGVRADRFVQARGAAWIRRRGVEPGHTESRGSSSFSAMPSGPRFAACSRTRRPPTCAAPGQEAGQALVQKAGRTLHPLDKEGCMVV